MKKHIFICLAILTLFSKTVSAQFTDLARIEYVGLPESSDGGTSFSRYRALVNYPIKLKKEGSFIILGVDYRYISYDIDDDLVSFDTEELSEFKQLSFTIGYTYKINEDWRFGAQIQPGYSTNLALSGIGFQDLTMSGNVVFIKDQKKSADVKKPNRLILGISLSGNGGFPVLPFISYYRKFHPKWSYNLGVPKTQLQYHLNERNRLKVVARIDGFRSSLQNGIVYTPGEKEAERFRQQLLLAGLRYEFKFTKNIEFYVNGSYIIDNSIELRDRSTNTLFEFEEESSFYIKTGLRFKI